MGFDQYHEPPAELPEQTRTFARLCASLTEEAEAIGWYQQRLALEQDETARAVMTNSLHEEYKHFSMDLEFLLRRTPIWRTVAQDILFRSGDIVEHGEEAEEDADESDSDSAPPPQASGQAGSGQAGSRQEASPRAGSLGIGSLKGIA